MTLSPALMNPAAPSGTTLVPIPIRAGLVFAAIAPVAAGALLFARSGHAAPLVVTPVVALGVAAITSPALYIALAATGGAPSPAVVARAVAMALAAFGIALAGLLLPTAFLSLSAVSPWTAVAVVSTALGAAALIALVRLGSELDLRGLAGRGVLVVWAMSAVGVAGRLWFDVLVEVMHVQHG
jgi:hypothetical protein